MTNNTQRNSHKVINWFLKRNSANPKGNGKTYLKWWKGRIYSQETLAENTQQDCHSDLTESVKWNKSFTDKRKLREFSTTKRTLQQMLKELL